MANENLVEVVLNIEDKNFLSIIENAKETLEGFRFTSNSVLESINNMVSGISVFNEIKDATDILKLSVSETVSEYEALSEYSDLLLNMGYSTDEVTAATGRLIEGIKGVPTTLEEIINISKNIANVTEDINLATEGAVSLNNAFISSGESFAVAIDGLNKYATMLSQGSVNAESWLFLQELMRESLEATAMSFGFTGTAAIEELYAALDIGNIAFTDFNARLLEMNETLDIVSEAGEIASTEMTSSWSNIEGTVTKGVSNIINELDDGFSASRFSGIGGNVEALGSVFEGVLGRLLSKIPPVSDVTETLTEKIDETADSFNIIDGIKEWIESINNVKKSVDDGKKAIGFLCDAMDIANKISETSISTLIEQASSQENSRLATVKKTAELVKDTAELIKNEAAEAARTFAVKASSGELVEMAQKLNDNVIVEIKRIAEIIRNEVVEKVRLASTALSTGAINAQAIASKIAAVATGVLNAAITLLSGPVGIIIAAIALLTAGVFALVKAFKKNSEESKKFEKSTEELKDANKELKNSVDESEKAYKGNTKSIEANYAVADKMLGKIDEISKKENKSAEDKAKLEGYVATLNKSVDGLNIAYEEGVGFVDQETGAIYDSVEALQSKIDAGKEQAKVQAMQERMIEVAKEQLEVDEQLEEVAKKKAEAIELYGEGSKKCKDKLDELNEEEEKLQETSNNLGDTFDDLGDKVGEGMAKSGEQAVETAKNISEAYDDLEENQKAALDGVIGAYKTMTSSLSDLSKKIVVDEKLAWSDVKANQNDTIEKTMEFSDNYSLLLKKGVSEEYLKSLGITGPESNKLLREMLDGNIDEVLQSQDEWKDAYGKIGDNLVDQFGLDENAQKLLKDYIDGEAGVKGTLKEAINNADFNELGKSISEGVEEGINENGEEASKAAGGMAKDVLTTAEDELGVNSPSKEFMKIGKFISDGLAKGIQDSESEINNAFKAIFTDLMKKINVIIKDSLNLIVSEFSDAFNQVSETVKANIDLMKSNIELNLSDIKSITINNLNSVKKSLDSTLSEMTVASGNKLKVVRENFIKTFTDVNTKANAMMTSTRKSVEKSTDTIQTSISDLYDKLYYCGENAITGLNNGLINKEGVVYETVKNIAENIPTVMESALKIQSPSRVLMEVGHFTIVGLNLGLIREMLVLNQIVKRMMTDMLTQIVTISLRAKACLHGIFSGNFKYGLLEQIKELNKEINKMVNLLTFSLNNSMMSHNISSRHFAISELNLTTTNTLIHQLIKTVEDGHVIMLDTGELVGSTYNSYDAVGGAKKMYSGRWSR